MPKFRVVIGTSSGKCLQKELAEDESKHFIGKQLKESIKGELIGFPGYEFLITGGSDYCGFPMRWDVAGTNRQQILVVAPTVGVKKASKSKKARVRKLVCGNTIHDKTVQINLKIVKEGHAPLFEEKKEEAAKTEAAKE